MKPETRQRMVSLVFWTAGLLMIAWVDWRLAVGVWLLQTALLLSR